MNWNWTEIVGAWRKHEGLKVYQLIQTRCCGKTIQIFNKKKTELYEVSYIYFAQEIHT